MFAPSAPTGDIVPAPRKRLSEKAPNFAAIAVIILAAALSTSWVFIVPIFQAPDEPAHFDYAISIFSRGLKNAGAGKAVFIASPYTLYLLRVTDFQRVAWHSSMRAPKGYGTPAYFARLDAGAPDPRRKLQGDRQRVSYVALSYPFAFYAAEALFMRFVATFTDSLTALFLSARILCVLFFVVALYFNYRTFVVLGLSDWVRVAIIFAIGLFPLATFVASYVQPDNLAYLLVSAALYYAVASREETSVSIRSCAVMGAILALLSVTKYQFFIATAIPIFVLLSIRLWNMRASARYVAAVVAALVVPSIGLLIFQNTYVAPPGMGKWGSIHSDVSFRIADELRGNPVSALAGSLALVGRGFFDCFISGLCAATYWQVVGWFDTPVIIVDWNIEMSIRIMVTLVSIAALIIVFRRVLRNVRIVLQAIVAKHARLALTAVSSDVTFNAYCCFLAIMVGLYVATHNAFGIEGRQLYPYAFVGMLTVAVHVPKSFGRRHVKGAQAVLSVMLAAYSAVAAVFALGDVTIRYYGTHTADFEVAGPPRQVLPASSALGVLRPVEPGDYHVVTSRGRFAFERKAGMRLVVTGVAAFEEPPSAASSVAVIVDNRFPSRVLTRQYADLVAEATRNSAYAYSGFYGILPISSLEEGPHLVRAFAAAPGSSRYSAIAPDRLFFLTGGAGRFSTTLLTRLAEARTVLGRVTHVSTCFGPGWAQRGILYAERGSVLAISGRLTPVGKIDSVWFDIGGSPYPAVVDYPKSDSRAPSSIGFFGTIPTAGLSLGSHSAHILAMASRDRTYYRLASRFRFKVFGSVPKPWSSANRVPKADGLCHDRRGVLAGAIP